MATRTPPSGPAESIAKEARGRRCVRVNVLIQRAENGVTYELRSHSPEAPIKTGKNGPKLVFNNNAGGQYHDGFEVVFQLEDQTNQGYLFHQKPVNPQPTDAMSVKLIDEHGYCPREGAKWAGFKPTEVTEDRLTLVVDNPNKYPQYFGFAFHFSKCGEQNSSLTYDPVGENQNSENID